MILIIKTKQREKMKKISFAALAVCILLILSGCERKEEVNKDGIDVVCTFYPQYSWVKNLTKDTGADVILLQKGGTDFHSFQPTFEDARKINTCDLLVCIGGESDEWAKEAAENGGNENIVSVMNEISDYVIDENVSDGMEHKESEKEKDEHVFLSVKNASRACRIIAEKLCEVDEKNEDKYKENLSEYLKKLEEIDKAFEEAVKNAKRKAFVMPDRYPFAYLARDYGLACFAAFAGCSSETDASFETVVFLSEKVRELDVKYVAVTENGDGKTAESVIEASGKDGVRTVILNSMQSLPEEKIENTEYTDIMLENLEALKLLLS